MTTSLDDIKNVNKNSVITMIHSEHLEFPYFFAGDDFLTWGYQTGLWNNNLFELLGFQCEAYEIIDHNGGSLDDEDDEDLYSIMDFNKVSSLSVLMAKLNDVNASFEVRKTQ